MTSIASECNAAVCTYVGQDAFRSWGQAELYLLAPGKYYPTNSSTQDGPSLVIDDPAANNNRECGPLDHRELDLPRMAESQHGRLVQIVVLALAEGDDEQSLLLAERAAQSENKPLIGVTRLVKRTRQPDSRLNADNLARPSDLIGRVPHRAVLGVR